MGEVYVCVCVCFHNLLKKVLVLQIITRSLLITLQPNYNRNNTIKIHFNATSQDSFLYLTRFYEDCEGFREI